MLDTAVLVCYNTAGIKDWYLTGEVTHGRIGDGAAV